MVGNPLLRLLPSSQVQLFGARTYAATSMRDISEAVGILPGSLYSHINSKEALLFEIVESGIERRATPRGYEHR